MKLRYWILSIALGSSMAAQAQELLSLQQCREKALQYNKQIGAAERQTQQARYTEKQYKALFFPDFKASGTAIYSTADGSLDIAGGNLPTFLPDASGNFLPNNGFAYFPGLEMKYELGWLYTGGISLEQPLYMGGKIRAANRIARYSREMAQHNERLTATEVILQTDEAYALVVKAREMKQVAEHYQALLDELLKNVESAERHGMKMRNDVLKVQVKRNECTLNLKKAENALRLATMNLCHAIGYPLHSVVMVSDELPEVPNVEDWKEIIDRPEYAILQNKVAIAEQQIKLTRSEMLPQVGLMAGYNYTHGLKMSDCYLFEKGSASVMVNVTIPLFHFGERHNKVKAAKEALRKAELERENLNEQMLLELAATSNNLEEAALEQQIATQSLEQAEENRRVSQSQYKAGVETLSDHLEANALWQAAHESAIDARYQHYIAYLKYIKAAGKLSADAETRR